jgi:hypothetical protein
MRWYQSSQPEMDNNERLRLSLKDLETFVKLGGDAAFIKKPDGRWGIGGKDIGINVSPILMVPDDETGEEKEYGPMRFWEANELLKRFPDVYIKNEY